LALPLFYIYRMRRKERKVKSVPQRKLMGYAYACATGSAKDCPPSVMDVADSFTRRGGKGLRSLRRMAATKHKGLSPTRVSESLILKYKDFRMHESAGDPDDGFDYLDFLYGLRDYEINEYLNEFITASNPQDKEEYIWCINKRIDEMKRAGRRFDETQLSLMRMSLEEVLQENIKKKNTKPK
jgi:hypothetical protein